MMNISTDEKDTNRPKLESKNINNNNNDDKLLKALARASTSSSSTTTSTSRQWSGFKNPRIVRVSRTFGGKDRHSKVCTIRGLRDRRIRLSVPTAIQLYDLQDRLGLSQPSKVIDWLLDATKLDIDKLPPLQIPPGNFAQFHQQSLVGQLANAASAGAGAGAGAPPHHFTPYLDANLTLKKEGLADNNSLTAMLSSKDGININDDLDEDDDDNNQSMDAKLETIKWNNRTTSEEEQYHQGGSANRGSANAQVSAQSFFPMGGSNAFLPGLMNSSALPYSNLYNWDPSNLSLSQFGSHGSLVPSQTEEPHHQGNHQLFFSPPVATTSLFPQHDTRFHLSNGYLPPFHSAGSGLRIFTPHHLQSGENNDGQQDKGDN